jgi:hypothetical protein
VRPVFRRSRESLPSIPARALLAALSGAAFAGAEATALTTATIAGSLQSEAGCAGDWDPACVATRMDNVIGEVFRLELALPAGSFEYKVAIDGGWSENYGAQGIANGANIPLTLGSPATVVFYYHHGTHWVTSSKTDVIATVPGSYQSEIGCSGDWAPECLLSWLQDADGGGVHRLTFSSFPVGGYEAKVAIDESWTENYGAGGVPGGPNIAFTVGSSGLRVDFSYDDASHVLTVHVSLFYEDFERGAFSGGGSIVGGPP